MVPEGPSRRLPKLHSLRLDLHMPRLSAEACATHTAAHSGKLKPTGHLSERGRPLQES